MADMTPDKDKVEAALAVLAKQEQFAGWDKDKQAFREALATLTEALAEARDGWHMANGVAELAMKHRDAAEKALAEMEKDAGRYFCDGPDGWFYTGTLEMARYLTAKIDPDGEDWTVTDLHNPFGDAAMQGDSND